MHGQRSAAARVDERVRLSNPTTPPAARAPLLKRGGEIRRGFRPRPPRPLRGHPSSWRRGYPTTPPPSAAPLLKRGGETQTPKSDHPKSGEPERRFLLGDELGDPPPRQRKERIHLRRGEGLAFGRSLDLD